MKKSEQVKFNKELGVLIRARRQALGMSQKEVAVQLGVTFQQVQKYEVGETAVSVYRLGQLSRVLGVSFGTYIGQDRPEPYYTILDKLKMDGLLFAARDARVRLEQESSGV